ncbi:MAG: hypothetical protein EPO58_09460 [Chitinophagaceae bacterium]|nr:MAG: hypothetical protein EPO58_09460 [Chitinophagaceae bacterium]
MKNQQKLFAFLTLMICFFSATAQKGIRGLVDAEVAFANFTESSNIKDGFLKYMDTAGVIFNQGRAMNAHTVYTKQKAGPAILSWAPNFAVVSAGGDMGVTTGPYLIRPKALTDTPAARGYFSSIWQMNSQGEWKNLADLGIASATADLPVREINEISLSAQKPKEVSFPAIQLMDSLLNQAIAGKNSEQWKGLLTRDSRLNLDQLHPLTGEKAITAALLNAPDQLQLRFLNGGLSAAKDFAYTYGMVTNGNRKENYLRAWIYQKKEWKLVLQTLKW